MIVQRSQTNLQSAHLYRFSQTREHTVRAWVGERPAPAAQAAARGPAVRPPARLSPVAEPATTDAADPTPGNAVQGRLATIVALVEWLTGGPVQVLDPAELSDRRRTRGTSAAGADRGSTPPAAQAPRAAAGWGVEVTTAQTTVEQETTEVTATSSVTLTDGRQLDVSLELLLNRETTTSSRTRWAAGDAVVTDPLMLGFGGAAGLGAGREAFDLDGDGADEHLPDAAAGSAFLVVDRNGNGVLDDGGELLGPATGDGFAELAGYDQDGNGWIDEGDEVFTRLGLATTGHGEVTSLATRGVGAIGLARVQSAFTYTTGDRLDGLLRSTGIWIGDDGAAGAVQQIDVADTP